MSKAKAVSTQVSADQSIIDNMPLDELLGTPQSFKQTPLVAAIKRGTLTEEEKKARRNEAQKALRSTPEGKAYANEASKKSIAKKKALIAQQLAELEQLKGLKELEALAGLEKPVDAPELVEPPVTLELAAEEAPPVEEVKVDEVVIKVKKPRKAKPSMMSDAADIAALQDAPF